MSTTGCAYAIFQIILLNKKIEQRLGKDASRQPNFGGFDIDLRGFLKSFFIHLTLGDPPKSPLKKGTLILPPF